MMGRNGFRAAAILGLAGILLLLGLPSAFPTSGPMGTSGIRADGVTVGLPFYTITFSESGLPTGTHWAVVLNGTTAGATAPSSVVFIEANGTYPFSVPTVTGYAASPTSGNVTTRTSGSTVGIRFASLPSVSAPVSYNLTFSETGLPNGTTWSVVLNGSNGTAQSPRSITFPVRNGSYPYSIGSIPGYAASPTSGWSNVSGTSVVAPVQFEADVQHVVLLVLENYELGTVLQNGPYERYLWNHYGQATSFYGTCHQSKPEYTALTSGRSFNCASFPVEKVTNLADLLEQRNLTWNGYFESMPNACATTSAFPYTIYHNPFLSYAD
ncbi:MAG TPA: hypothetical protein VGV64_05695, partial [Thermoplasmata archaeon]|nr:hypothetical protein [Thermoplasmata archaeon]